MNKGLVIYFIFFINILYSQENNSRFSQQTNLNLGYYHLGSYSKERPSIFLEHQVNFNFIEKWSAGLGAGVNLYPGALAYPILVELQYHFNLGKLPVFIAQGYGMNLKLGEFSFFSHRNTGGFNAIFMSKKRIQFFSGLGYLFLWDNYGGKNISFILNFGVKF